MKKLTKYLILMAILFVLSPQKSYAQYTICPPEGTIFSLPPENSDNAFTSAVWYNFFCYQSFHGVEGAIWSVTFWGVWDTVAPGSGTFLINICNDSLNKPSAVVTSLTASISGVATGEILLGHYDIYVFTVDVPLTTLESGWVGVQEQTSFQYPKFSWLNTYADPPFPAVQNNSYIGTLALEMCVIDNVGISEPTESSFSLYPNPADDHVYIDTPDELKHVSVYNVISQMEANEIITGRHYELKTSGYTIGMYMVRVETETGMTTRRLTIQR